MRVWSLGQEDALEEGMATHSSILSCRIPWTEEPDGLPSMGFKELDMTEATEHAGIVDLQCYVSFRCIAKWINYIYTCIYSFLDSFPT